MKGKVVFSVFAVLLVIIACAKDKAIKADCVDEISFAADVKPIIDVNCSTSGCHDASLAGGYNLSTYSGVETNADRILSVINHDAGFIAMPQGADKLADSVIKKVECWIKQGKLDN